MPDPERLLKTLQQACQAYRDTPGRTGHVVDLVEVEELLVVGDLHGHLEHFRHVLGVAELARFPRRHLVLQEIIHGPYAYPDGSDKSHQLFDVVAALKCQFPKQVHLLPGNHELAQWTGRPIEKNDVVLNDNFSRGVRAAYGARAEEIEHAYHLLFARLPCLLRTPNRICLSHSLPTARRRAEFALETLHQDEFREADLLPGGSVFALVWGRDTSLANVEAFLNLVDADLLITGHIPCLETGFATPNTRQLILDGLSHPAAYCLFPTSRPLTHDELVSFVKIID